MTVSNVQEVSSIHLPHSTPISRFSWHKLRYVLSFGAVLLNQWCAQMHSIPVVSDIRTIMIMRH